MKKVKVLSEALLLMIVIQALRIALESLISKFVKIDTFSERMITMSVMICLSGLVVLYARIRKTSLSVFPERFGKFYIICTVIGALILITTPMNFIGGYPAILLLVYGSLVTPIFEELIFRGYLWNRLNTVFSKEVCTYICSIVLFMLWHIGYMIPQIIEGSWTPVLWKLAAGLGYGTVLGFVRLKCKNCYITMLLHGVLNDFMI